MIPRILFLTALSTGLISGQDVFLGVKRIVAVGDVHGGYSEFVTLLRQAGIIDASNKWIGGATHLVQLGDVLDRGADSRKALDLLASLEGPARKAKGRVHSLIGNHEAMNMYGDLRYVSSGEYAAFQTKESAELRERAYEALADPARKDDAAYRKEWDREHPLGWVEHRQSFAPDGVYGKTFLQHKIAIKINDTLFLHGGIGPKFASMPLEEINSKARNELKGSSPLEIVSDDEGPLWYRGLASSPEDTLSAHVDEVLKNFGILRIVLGHTPTQGTVMPRFNGRVLLADVGLSKFYNSSPSSLLIEDGKAFALHRGTRLEIPAKAEALSAYLKAAAALDPPGTNLRKYVETLGLR